MRNLLFVMSALLLVSCGKGDPQKCDAACRNYATLMYWETADAEIARTPPAQREALKKQKVFEYAAKLESGLEFCVSKCQAADNDTQIKCLTNAKSAPEVKACTAED